MVMYMRLNLIIVIIKFNVHVYIQIYRQKYVQKRIYKINNNNQNNH